MLNLAHPIIIAIDGHSSCGKSSFAKSIAKELNYLYVDSGAMYRAVTLFAIRNNWVSKSDVQTLKIEDEVDNVLIDFRYNQGIKQFETFLDGENVETEIRTMAVSELVSEISKIKKVRERLVALQQKFGEKKGIVMDGRDIGTVVYPNAEVKLFMTASIEVRAQRRYQELVEKGMPASFDEIKENLAQRDFMDQNRKESPLKQAADAIVLDNSSLTPPEQMVWFKNLLKEKFL